MLRVFCWVISIAVQHGILCTVIAVLHDIQCTVIAVLHGVLCTVMEYLCYVNSLVLRVVCFSLCYVYFAGSSPLLSSTVYGDGVLVLCA